MWVPTRPAWPVKDHNDLPYGFLSSTASHFRSTCLQRSLWWLQVSSSLHLQPSSPGSQSTPSVVEPLSDEELSLFPSDPPDPSSELDEASVPSVESGSPPMMKQALSMSVARKALGTMFRIPLPHASSAEALERLTFTFFLQHSRS